ncbi:class I SAM-dependent RNA methyltransferase [Flavisphingomonas formosensis]|uniref:class I SAM-dependent RNA methyltransferase n=1 Tax=Flavisphingomonas formosensis TaxID=861534 RepID=UPI0012FA593D|nr:class I SAM-dependent RNA methyltransferase [Sphingomonas formosensis]
MSEGDLVLRIAGRGDGLTASGRYVPLTAPGDLVLADGSIVPGPNHVDPPCRHFPVCGGCQLQHVDDAVFADFITGRIARALAAQGLDAPEIRLPHISPPHSRRRVSMRAERRGKRVLLGFNEEGSHRIVDLAQCEIMAPALFALVAPLRALLGELVADRRAADVQMTLADQGVDLLLGKVETDGLARAERLTVFAQSHGLARLMVDEGYGPEARWEPDAVTITLGGVAVPLPPAAFLQATPDGEAALVAATCEAAGDAKIVADLFSGLGTFALPLAGRGARVYAAEGARDAVLALKAGAGRAGRTLFVEHRDLFRRPLAPAELDRFDAIILDPPRAGAKEQAVQLAASQVRRIVYASCNPATFARDAKALVDGGYRLDWIAPVGQFRWSTHIELVVRFTRS